MSLISVQLIKLATADIEYEAFENASFLTYIPVGFFGCEYTISVVEESSEELISFNESVIVYEFNKEKYMELIDYLLKEDLTEYSDEKLTDDQLESKANDLANEIFNIEVDSFDGLLISNITKLLRHIAQNSTAPVFLDFHERDKYDLDKIAEDLIEAKVNILEIEDQLKDKFIDNNLLWEFFYKRFGGDFSS